MTTYLVTGSGGFVGSHTVSSLVAAGHRVRATWRTRRPDLGGAEWAGPVDLETTGWGPLLEGVDVVIHAAGLAHVRPQQATDAAMFRANAHTVERLAAAAAGVVGRLVLVSSIAAVGDASDVPVTVDTPSAPSGAYGASKLEGERLLAKALDGSETEWVVLRPPLVYGRGAPGNLARLARLVARGVPLPFASVHNRRSLIGIDNLVDALARASIASGVTGGVFPVADDEVVSTAGLVRLIAGAMGVPARLVPVPAPVLRLLGRGGDVVATVLRRPVPVDGDAIGRLTGSLELDDRAFRHAARWAPPVTLADGIAAAFGPQAGGATADP